MKTMTYQELVNYIRRAKDAGLNDQTISSNLLKAGWHQVDVDGAFNVINRFTARGVTSSSASRHLRAGLFIFFLVSAAVLEGLLLYLSPEEFLELKDYTVMSTRQLIMKL